MNDGRDPELPIDLDEEESEWEYCSDACDEPEEPNRMESSDPEAFFASEPFELREMAKLNDLQSCAVAHVTKHAKVASERAMPRLLARLLRWGYDRHDLHELLRYIRDDAPLIVHVDLPKTLALIVDDPALRNLFEVRGRNESGGSNDVSARAGWEKKIFGGHYDRATPAERVKYGVLNVVRDPCGIEACEQYGQSYFELHRCRLRTTFASKDTSYRDVELASCEQVHMHMLCARAHTCMYVNIDMFAACSHLIDLR